MQKHFLLAACALAFNIAAPASAQMSLPGNFEVTDTGSASYTIPISVVPGTAGLEPKLALQYDSRSGNGLLGVGWSLSGLPSIIRCGRTIAQDGQAGGVAYDAHDRFCLDDQRLIAISGTYGADQTEYRTERESFSKIVSYGTAGSGPAHFKVWTKAGLIMEFGNTADSRIEAQGKPSVRVWALNKTSDTKSNFFTVSYLEDNANGEYRPDRIDYTGNAGTNTQPANSVRFIYEARPDIVPFYQVGSLIKTTKRFTKVQAWQGENLIQEYKVAYASTQTGDRSKVNDITLCFSADSCLSSTNMAWSPDPTTGYTTPIPYSTIESSNSWQYYALRVADFNGDGLDDLLANYMYRGGWRAYVAFANGDGTFQPAAGGLVGGMMDNNGGGFDLMQMQVADLNADGRADLVGIYPWGTSLVAYNALGNGDGTFQPLVFTQVDLGTESWTNFSYHIADFNGDGLPDLLANHVYYGGWRAYVAHGNGDGTFQQAVGAVVGGIVEGTGGNMQLFQIQVADYSGDGKADILGSYAWGTSWQIYLVLGAGDGTFPVMKFTQADLGTASWQSYSIHTSDFNGDGLPDILANYLYHGGWRAYAALGNGDGTFQPAVGGMVGGMIDGTGGNTDLFQIQLFDYNGDGFTDLHATYVWGASWQTYVARGKGDGTFPNMSFNQVELGTPGWQERAYTVGDFTGDGSVDLVSYSLQAGSWTAYTAKAATRRTQIDAITSGIGSNATVAYKSLAGQAAPYNRDTDTSVCVYPCVDIQAPLYVVSEVKSSNGLGGEYRSTYRYVGAKSDQHGRGFLGFRQMVVKDEQTGVEQVTSYRQDYPFTGLVASREKKLGSQLLNRSTNTYSSTDLGGTRRYPFLTLSQEESWELNGSALPSVTTGYQYDAYGNATQVSVSTGDGHSKATTNTYQNDAANWHLGRLTRSEVTSTTPSQ